MRLLLCSLLLVLSGCGLFSSTPVIHPLWGNEAYSIPVVPAKVDVQEDLGTQGFQATPGGAPEMVITVTDPITKKNTIIEIKKAKRTFVEKVLTNKPVYEVKSDSKNVTAAQPKQTLWWKWIAAGVSSLLVLALIVMVAANKLSSFSPWGFILGLFKRK